METFGTETFDNSRSNLTKELLEYITKGKKRAEDKFMYFYPGTFLLQDKIYGRLINQIKEVIDLHNGSKDFNPRFFEIFVETTYFCQMVRRHNNDKYLTNDELNNILEWLSVAINSFKHL